MARRALAFALAAVLVLPAGARASTRIARRSGLSCTMCHLDARGQLGLTVLGERHRKRGLRASLDPELTVPGELRPLSPGGARMLHRRVRELGRRLFRMRDLGRSRRACQSCHAGGENLAANLVDSYPRYRADRQRWMTLEGAVQDCLVRQVGSEPLKPGTRSAIALRLYLREVAGEPARPYVDDAAWGMVSRSSPDPAPGLDPDPEREATPEAEPDELEDLDLVGFDELDGDL